jgi:hypothetical protein
MTADYEGTRKEKEEKELVKWKAKEAKEQGGRAEEDAKRKNTRSRRQPFDFEKVYVILPIHGDKLRSILMVSRKNHKC